MNLHKCLATKNECYKIGAKITVKGLMLHSTGANNPKLSRYVQPDDGNLGKNPYDNSFNEYRPGGRQVCVHGFIGYLKDMKTVASYQTLPWNMKGWHGGSGPRGCVNNTHIGIEMCEDGLSNKAYFNAVYKEAVELFAYLCKTYNLNPTGDGIIIAHYEGYNRGIASNHGDPKVWFNKQGKTMDGFRKDVAAQLKVLNGGTAPSKPSTPTPPKPSTPTPSFKPYLVKVTTAVLNIRSGAGTTNKVVGTVKKGDVYTIVSEAKAEGLTWGKLKSGAGWIALTGYTKKA